MRATISCVIRVLSQRYRYGDLIPERLSHLGIGAKIAGHGRARLTHPLSNFASNFHGAP